MRSIFQRSYKVFTEIIFKSLYGKILLKHEKIKSIKQIKIKNKFFNNKKYFTYEIENGRIFTDNVQHVASISKNILHGPSSFQHADNKIISPKLNIVLKKGTPKIRKKYNGTILSLIQGASTENYFHWLMDILPKIKICSENYSLDKINYFYLPNLTNSQTESLKYLGIKKNRIINSKTKKHIAADRIIFTSHPWYTKGKFHDQSSKLPKWIIIWIKKTFLNYKKKFKISKKIYLDRSESKHPHCQIINHKKLKSYLKKGGFESVKLTKLSFANQIFMFWNAEYVIGAHGAAFTNIVFCKPKTKIIEFRPYGHPGKNYQRIAQINNLKYDFIVSKKKYLNKKNGDIFINLEDLKKKII